MSINTFLCVPEVLFVFCSFLIYPVSDLYAQQFKTSSLWLESLEQLATDSEQGGWNNDLEELSHYLQHPLDLNAATRRQLETFPFLSDVQIENLLAYVYIHGFMQTVHELQLVSEIDKHTIDLLLPFVCVKTGTETKKSFLSLKDMAKYGKHEVLARLDVPFYTRRGYEKSYLGPSLYHSLRYAYRYGDNVQVGLTGEKDAGEPFFALYDRKGYDYYSYYLVLRNMGFLQTLALGNYRLGYGQGLVLGGSGFGVGKSFSLATVRGSASGIRKHSSTDEYNYFRGVAAEARLLPSLRFSAFYSHRRMDGTVKDGVITSIYKTGLHRTQSEADKKGAFAMQLAGGNLAFGNKALQVGMTGIYYFFDHPYEPALRTYSKYNLHGNRFYNLGMDYRYRLGRFSLAGEAAKGKQGYALLNRLQYDLASDYRLLIVHRFYTHDYWSFFAKSFSEGSNPQNENGWYLASEIFPFSEWKFFGSLDFFSFPWWKYRISKPSQGWEGRFQADCSLSESLSMYANYRYKRRERDVSGTGGKSILPTHHHRARYRLNYAAGSWTLRTTVDYNSFHLQDKTPGQGWLCTQMCGYLLPWFPLAITVQGSYFHTDDYDSRVYAYEKGLLDTFYTPAFSGRGFRCSAHVRCDWNDTWMLLVKFGQTVYQDRDTIGSGNDLIEGNKKGDLQMQLRIKF